MVTFATCGILGSAERIEWRQERTHLDHHPLPASDMHDIEIIRKGETIKKLAVIVSFNNNNKEYHL